MSVKIKKYNDELLEKFQREKARLSSLLIDDIEIHHIGSSAVGIGGKNIVDILIGVKDEAKMEKTRDVLSHNGYFPGRGKHSDRIFMATSEEETGEGDFHVHICLKDSDTYRDMLTLRDYLSSDAEEARKYERAKVKFAEEAKFDREKYKALKSQYVSELLKRAKQAT